MVKMQALYLKRSGSGNLPTSRWNGIAVQQKSTVNSTRMAHKTLRSMVKRLESNCMLLEVFGKLKRYYDPAGLSLDG
jgi:hypothetical protein